MERRARVPREAINAGLLLSPVMACRRVTARNRVAAALPAAFSVVCSGTWIGAVALPTGTSGSPNPSVGECGTNAGAINGATSPPTATRMVLSLPLSGVNIAAILVLLTFSCLGCIFLWKLVTRRKCNCKLCAGDYTIKSVIGSGGYGQVFTVTRSSDRKVLVLKKIGVDDITDANFAQAEARELRALKHPRIVGYEDDFVHVEWTHGLTGAMELEPKFFLGIVMEYCPNGDLSDRIAAAHGRSISSGEDEMSEDELPDLPDSLDPEEEAPVIAEPQILTWFSQMAESLAYIHEQNIIHRDIKSQNFFLKANGSVQLGDFGLCRRAVTQTITVGGTDVYMAPEMVLGKRYGKEADVWALGCVLFEMCTGRFMWEIPGILGAQTAASQSATQKLLNVVPHGYSDGVRALIGGLLQSEPRRRPTAAALYSGIHLSAKAQASEGASTSGEVTLDLDSIFVNTRGKSLAGSPMPSPTRSSPPSSPAGLLSPVKVLQLESESRTSPEVMRQLL